jgi:hypothetical protein
MITISPMLVSKESSLCMNFKYNHKDDNRRAEPLGQKFYAKCKEQRAKRIAL